MKRVLLMLVLFLVGCGEDPPVSVKPDATDPVLAPDVGVVLYPDATPFTPDAMSPGLDAATAFDASMPLDADVQPGLDATTVSPDAAMPPDAAADPCLTMNCNDNSPCTDDSCVLGSCVHTPNTNTCDDGDACTTNDHCLNSACIGGVSPNCDDGNPCSFDSCDHSTGCKHTNVPDGLTCGTVQGLKCYGGQCQCSIGLQEVCNDGIDNNCDGKTDCQDPACNGQACDTHDLCSPNGTCQGLTCVGIPVVCAVSPDQCHASTGTCNPATGICVYQPKTVGTSCDADNDPVCTPYDVCGSDGACHLGSQIPCEDNNACTTDSCQSRVCKHDPVSDGTTCSGGVCKSGSCCTGCLSGATCLSGTDSNNCGKSGLTCQVCPPPGDECHAVPTCPSGQCVYAQVPNNTPCSIGVCENGTCINPVCGVIGKRTCQPGDPYYPVVCMTGVSTYGDVCAATCGGYDDFCCLNGGVTSCVGPGMGCASWGVCRQNCGATNQSCCQTGTPDPDQLLNSAGCQSTSKCTAGPTSSSCYPPTCGDLNQPCCPAGTPTSGSMPLNAGGCFSIHKCVLGFCTYP